MLPTNCSSPLGNYSIGDVSVLKGTFTDDVNVPIDPTIITLLVKLPNDNIQTFTYADNQIIKLSTGVYTYDFSITLPGVHYWRYEGAGACQAQKESKFNVLNSAII